MATDPLNSSEVALIEAALALTAGLDVQRTCTAILDAAEHIFAAESCWVLLHDPEADELVTVEVRGRGVEAYAQAHVPCERGIVGIAFSRQETVFVPDATQEDRWYDPQRVQHAGLRSACTIPLMYQGVPLGVMGLDSPMFSADSPPSAGDISRLRAIGAIAATGIRNAQTLKAVELDRQRLQDVLQQRRQLRDQIGHLRRQVREFQGGAMIGDSAAHREVVNQIALVAPADSTVLLIGETGTGKELMARTLHDRSRRDREPFVAVNCAALPESLVESELFGYEKGAFTGALARRIGSFELADRGTLFLDEIGDLPAPAQAKLLRVLQEREIQRVGGTKPIAVNVRVVAATNQDLEALTDAGRFRADLYYRLSVFPIRLPALRERHEDIPRLVGYFVQRFADQQHKPAPRLGPGVLQRLMAYHWPGNIRELQNVVERAVILAQGAVLDAGLFPEPHTMPTADPRPLEHSAAHELHVSSNGVRFADAERHAIARALDLTGWRISGRGGAADILGLKPTTLHAKMRKLGIFRPSCVSEEPSDATA